MKKASDVFKSIRFAKGEPRDTPHSSTDDEEHYAVGEKEFNQQLKHAKKRAMQEQEDKKEYDYEGEMVKSDLRSIMANAQRIIDMTEDDDNLPEWCQNKITLAEDYVSTVANYLTAEMNEETINEVSDEMLSRYKEKAKKDADKLDSEKKYGKALKRRVGVLNAVGKMVGRAGENLSKLSKEEVELAESGGKVVWKKGDHHIEKYGEDAFALYSNGKKQKYYTSIDAAKDAIKEEVEQLDEKNAPTNPGLWSRAKALARSKFDVYPSAYANGWAAKWYKSKGGGWKSVSEATELPFEPDKKPVKKATPGKYGAGYSTARHLARMAMQKQVEKYKKPIKEEEMSKKAKIVKDVMKKKNDEKTDKFQSEPVISQSVTRNY